MRLRHKLNKILASYGLSLERSIEPVLNSDARLVLNFDFLVTNEISHRGNRFRFMQIGANDGVSRPDDLIKYVKQFDLAGVVVEPQPDMFEVLKSNFSACPNVEALNKAIHSEKESMPLYRFNPAALSEKADLPNWARTNGIASFNRDQVFDKAKELKLPEDTVEELTVECIGINELMAEQNQEIALLKIDVEGYDFRILEDLDLGRFRPAIIRFENHYLSKEEYRTVMEKYTAAGYRFLADRDDTTMYRIEPFAQ